MRTLVLVAAAGCWTGGETTTLDTTSPNVHSQPAPAARARFKVELERTECDGPCRPYSIVIHGDGLVEWERRANLRIGERRGRWMGRGEASERDLAELERAIDKVRFFERDRHGHLPIEQQCTTTNGTTTCTMGGSFSFCTDTSHTIITVTRKSKKHTVDNANCSETNELESLESVIDRIANVPLGEPNE